MRMFWYGYVDIWESIGLAPLSGETLLLLLFWVGRFIFGINRRSQENECAWALSRISTATVTFAAPRGCLSEHLKRPKPKPDQNPPFLSHSLTLLTGYVRQVNNLKLVLGIDSVVSAVTLVISHSVIELQVSDCSEDHSLFTFWMHCSCLWKVVSGRWAGGFRVSTSFFDELWCWGLVGGAEDKGEDA